MSAQIMIQDFACIRSPFLSDFEQEVTLLLFRQIPELLKLALEFPKISEWKQRRDRGKEGKRKEEKKERKVDSSSQIWVLRSHDTYIDENFQKMKNKSNFSEGLLKY